MAQLAPAQVRVGIYLPSRDCAIRAGGRCINGIRGGADWARSSRTAAGRDTGAAGSCATGAAGISRRRRTSSVIIGRALTIEGRSSTAAQEA